MWRKWGLDENVASLMMCSDDYICPLNYPLPATEGWSLTQHGPSPSGANIPDITRLETIHGNKLESI